MHSDIAIVAVNANANIDKFTVKYIKNRDKMKKGVVEIENMEFYAFHGCYEQEKIVGNRFLVSLAYQCDVRELVESDDIRDAVSYLEIYALVEEQMMISSNTIEHVSARIIDSVMEQYPQIKSLTIKLSKMNPPLGGLVERVSFSVTKSR